MKILGIDIGGSGIKGALVDMKKGRLATKRVRIPTPTPSTPQAVGDVVRQIVAEFDYSGPLGVGFPAAIIGGVVKTAANVDDAWIGYEAERKLSKATGSAVTFINDADAAGLAEMRFGAGQGQDGVVFVFTLGTGIGSSLYSDGVLVPNTELGHLFLPGQTQDAEHRAAERVRSAERLSWEAWAARLDEYLHHVYGLFWPDLIILGGGVSKKHEKFISHLTVPTAVVPARLRNEAGIVGAALAAAEARPGD